MNLLPSRRPVKAEGNRPTVICLDPGLGVTLQRQSLPERLRFRNRVLAPELRGYAASRASGTALSLDAEAASIAPLVDVISGKVYLVGHGYGAAVALRLALARRERIAGLVLYEPTLFSLLLADPGSRDAAMDIAVLRRVLRRYLDAGDGFRAALRYVEHWSGREAFHPGAGGDRLAHARAVRAARRPIRRSDAPLGVRRDRRSGIAAERDSDARLHRAHRGAPRAHASARPRRSAGPAAGQRGPGAGQPDLHACVHDRPEPRNGQRTSVAR
ncbi:MAG: alpha/beta fold hydrolase, partial [Gammaproteobacteria bacterium]